MGSFSMQAAAINLTSLLPRRDFRSPLPLMSIIGETQNLGKLKLGELLVATRLWSTPTARLSPMQERGQGIPVPSAGVDTGPSTARMEISDEMPDTYNSSNSAKPLKMYPCKICTAGLIEDDRLQFDAFAQAIANGTDRDWMQDTTLGTWVLMEACNESARTHEKVDVEAFAKKMLAYSNRQ